MDTPTISAYYREIDPMKRKKLLDRSVAENEDPQMNPLRQELWEIRYREKSKSADVERADGFMALLMDMELGKGSVKKLFGGSRIKKDIRSRLDKLEFERFARGDELQQEALYRECCHLVQSYMQLCLEDKTYGTAFLGIVPMKKENILAKLRADIFETFIQFPCDAQMQEELSCLTRAARAMYALQFPEDEPFPEPTEGGRK